MIHVIWNESVTTESRAAGRDDYSPYIAELLSYAGMDCRLWSPDEWAVSPPAGLTIVVGSTTPAMRQASEQHCSAGNVILAVGDTYGLDELLGVERKGIIREGWTVWEEGGPADGLRSSLHFYGGVAAEAKPGTEKKGRISGTGLGSGSPALTMRRYGGSGIAAMLAVNLARTFVAIQQGVPVARDGVPAPDGTAAVDDGILKSDDGAALDWTHDRDAAAEEGAPFYRYPIVDEYRILFIRLLFDLHAKSGTPFAQGWYWPDGIEAIGHISHDSDGNGAEAARLMLGKLEEAGVRSTWCVMMPGYTEDIYAEIAEGGHEIAFHYNALESEEGSWGEPEFVSQLRMLRRQVGDDFPIVTNKNHYMRWEGGVEFYRWCERAGIRLEQTKGGTKRGNKGFLAGTCHPFAPVAGAEEHNRTMEVFVLPTLAWDPPVPHRCTIGEARAILNECRAVGGVAHFLFHPAMLAAEERIGDAMVELAAYGRNQEMVWWTSEQLYRWLRLRRGVRLSVESNRIVATAECEVKAFTLLSAHPLLEESAVRRARPVLRYGLPLYEAVLDLPEGRTELELAIRSEEEIKW